MSKAAKDWRDEPKSHEHDVPMKTENKLAVDKVADEPKPEKATVTPIKKADVKLVSDVNQYPDESIYPFADMTPGGGFFVANEPNQTTEQTLDRVSAHVARANVTYSEPELDQNGDEVWEEIIIRGFKRKPNGDFELDSVNKPVPTSDHMIVPRRVYARHYVARRVFVDDMVAGKKSEDEGVLVIRVA